MTKQQFLQTLTDGLSNLPKKEVNDIISDYEEHFDIGQSQGRSEKELVASLGDPNQIAKQLNANFTITQAEKTRSVTNITRAVLATTGLGFVNLFFVAGPYAFAVFMLVCALFFGIGAVVTSSFFFFISLLSTIFSTSVFNLAVSGIAAVFLSLSGICFGVLFLIAWFYITKWFYILTVRYLKFNLNVIRGKE